MWRSYDTQTTRMTNQCHDITVFPTKNIAAGACSGNGILFDISSPYNPERIDVVTDTGFAYWHSATFNNDGTKVVLLTNGVAVEGLDVEHGVAIRTDAIMILSIINLFSKAIIKCRLQLESETVLHIMDRSFL